MKLSTFLEMLTEVELSQHIFGGLDEDGRLLKRYELVNLINRGLEDLHTRFLIKKGELYLNVDTSVRERYDVSDESLILTEDIPLNIIKILEVWDECGEQMSFNTIHRRRGCGEVCGNEIQMLDKTTLIFNRCCGCFKVIYHKGPDLLKKPVSVDRFQPEKMELDISLEYIDALIYYVVSRLFSINPPMEGYAAPYSPSITYSRKYEEECNRLKDLNFEIDGTGDVSQRFYDSTFP